MFMTHTFKYIIIVLCTEVYNFILLQYDGNVARGTLWFGTWSDRFRHYNCTHILLIPTLL